MYVVELNNIQVYSVRLFNNPNPNEDSCGLLYYIDFFFFNVVKLVLLETKK